jgi:hypothetical protein
MKDAMTHLHNPALFTVTKGLILARSLSSATMKAVTTHLHDPTVSTDTKGHILVPLRAKKRKNREKAENELTLDIRKAT